MTLKEKSFIQHQLTKTSQSLCLGMISTSDVKMKVQRAYVTCPWSSASKEADFSSFILQQIFIEHLLNG